jgi:hypothetical protein
MLKFSWPLRPVSHFFLVLMLVDVRERHAAAQPPPTVGSGVVEGRTRARVWSKTFRTRLRRRSPETTRGMRRSSMAPNG